MKSLFLFMSLLSLPAFADSEIEKNLFFAIKDNGAYVEVNTSNITNQKIVDLASVGCSRLGNADLGNAVTRCTYVDRARPKETATMGDHASQIVFNSLVAAGAKEIHAFGADYINAENLKCEEFTSVDTTYSCRVSKPLLGI